MKLPGVFWAALILGFFVSGWSGSVGAEPATVSVSSGLGSGLEPGVRLVLEARAWLAEGQAVRAESQFASVAASGLRAGGGVFVGATLGLAEARAAQGAIREALRGLGSALRMEQELQGREALYAKYVELLQRLPEGSEGELREWGRSGSAEQRGAALFYLGCYLFETGRWEEALEEWIRLTREFPGHPLRGEATVRIADEFLRKREGDRAVEAVREAMKYPVGMRVGEALRMRLGAGLFQRGQWEEAQREFRVVAEVEGELRREALFNVGLAEVRGGRSVEVQGVLEELRRLEGGESLALELETEGVMQQLRSGDEEVDTLVRRFETGHPEAPRLAELWLARAEWSLEQALGMHEEEERARWQERARELFQRVQRETPKAAGLVSAEYLAFFLAASGEFSWERALELGEAFLKNHPSSELCAEVVLKLGEVSFRRKDFARAEAWFAAVEPFRIEAAKLERALFLAGNSAAELASAGSVDRALAYWNRVVEGQGTLKAEARYQQAVVKSRMGQEAEALVLFDLILEAAAAGTARPEMRWMAWCGKADALLSLDRRRGLGEERAVVEYQALAAAEEVPVYWRNQALYKMGKAVEARDAGAALRSFQAVFEAPGSVEQGEFFWGSKAGFDAARILEGEKRWPEAVAVYERMVGQQGPRSEEARLRARQLRLEHFLWE